MSRARSARLISLVEDASPLLREVMAGLAPHTGHARVVGITGSPGSASPPRSPALVDALCARRDKRVGVLAVDPSSPFSGGALLGDRVRMQDHALDRDVFIRSMATRGHLGGLAWSTPQAIRVLDAAGFDMVLVETVGVGQSEVEIAALADTTLVLLAPGMGDGIQAAKAGILEVGDLYVVNKADRDGATRCAATCATCSRSASRPAGAWKPPILITSRPDREGVPSGGRGDRRPRRLARGAPASWADDARAGPAQEIESIALARCARAGPGCTGAAGSTRSGRPGGRGRDRPVRRRGRLLATALRASGA